MNDILQRLGIFLLFIILANSAAAQTLVEDIRSRVSAQFGYEEPYILLHSGKKYANSQGVALKNIEYDISSNHFKAIIINDKQHDEVVYGKFGDGIKLPVLNQPVKKMEIVQPGSVIYQVFPARQDYSKFCMDEACLVGKSAKRNLLTNRAIESKDLGNPVIINKGALVKVIFSKGQVNIESAAIAMDAGGIDDVIRLRNQDSNKVLQGKILNEEYVVLISHSDR